MPIAGWVHGSSVRRTRLPPSRPTSLPGDVRRSSISRARRFVTAGSSPNWTKNHFPGFIPGRRGADRLPVSLDV